jgi:hypothetical protein
MISFVRANIDEIKNLSCVFILFITAGLIGVSLIKVGGSTENLEVFAATIVIANIASILSGYFLLRACGKSFP